jgi:hypothetical protein
MIERVAAAFGSLDEHPQIGARLLLPDELIERLGTDRGFECVGLALGPGHQAVIGRVGHSIAVSRFGRLRPP